MKPIYVPYKQIRVDSLKLRIPIDLVRVLDESIFDTYSEINDATAEISSEQSKRKVKEFYTSETSKIKVSIEQRMTSDGVQECIMLLLNSKFTKRAYFEGIHYDALEQIYKDIIDLKIFEMDFDDFVRCDVTDVDIKLDESMSQLSWAKIINLFKQNTKASPQAGKGYTPYPPTRQKPYQNGLQFGTRTGATDPKPFIKLYWKGGELLSNSEDFYNEHIKGGITQVELLNIVRIEATIKNKNHASRCGIENFTLLGVLSLREEQLLKAFQYMAGKYINPVTFNYNTPKVGLSATELVLHDALKLGLNYTSIEIVVDKLIQSQRTASAKSKKKRLLLDIYNEYIKDCKTLPTDNDSLKYLQFFNLVA